MNFHFIRPEWLLALIPLTVILLILWRQKGANTDWNRYIPNHLSVLLIDEANKQNKSLWYWLAFSWLVAVLALSGPAVNKQSLPVFAKHQGRILVMDMSLSMYATDLAPNRLAQSHFRAIDLLNGIKEGETGLVAYAGDAFVISPLTQDNATLLNLLPTLSPEIMPVRGSSMASAIKKAQQLLAQGGHLRGDILIFTDGINNRDFDASMALVKNSPYRLGILAIGSQQGAPIKLPDGQLQRDNSNEIVIAKTQYELLNQLATESQGRLFPAQTDGSDTSALISWLESEGTTQETELSGEIWQDLGPYLAIFLLLPALLSFRHGTMFLLVGMLLIPAPKAQANTWDDLWKNQDQQAMETYSKGNFNDAAKQFEHEQWQANAQYKAGDYQKALEGFEKDHSAQGLYNQGNALMQQSKYADAKQKYQKALELKKDFEQAKANNKLAEQLEKQQKQQQDQQGSDKQNSDEKNSEENQSEDGDAKESNSTDPDKQKSDSQGDKSQQQDQQDDSQEQSDEQSQDTDSKETGSDTNKESDNSNDAESADQDSQMQASADEQNLSEKEKQAQQNSTESEQNKQQEQDEKTQVAQMSSSTDKNDSENNQQQGSVAQAEASDLPPDMERALQAIKEEPQVLLRNKMQLEYQKRRQRGELTQESQQW